MEQRSLPVPEGLAGERADAGLAKLLGFSRSFAAEVLEAGGVRLDGGRVKDDRWKSELPEPAEPESEEADPVEPAPKKKRR